MTESSVLEANRKRRRFTAAFKARSIDACQQPGASVAGIALEHGLNANLVHKWIHTARRREMVTEATAFVPVPRTPASAPPAPPHRDADRIRLTIPSPQRPGDHGVAGIGGRELPVDNNRMEDLIRPWALGHAVWPFVGSLRSGQHVANIMSLIQSAKLNSHEPYAYLKDVLERLPTQKASQNHELPPQNWQKPPDHRPVVFAVRYGSARREQVIAAIDEQRSKLLSPAIGGVFQKLVDVGEGFVALAVGIGDILASATVEPAAKQQGLAQGFGSEVTDGVALSLAHHQD